RWMAGAGAEPGDLTVQVAERYASARRAAGYVSYRSVHALEPLLGYLRGLGVAPAAEVLPLTAAEELLVRFQRYLVSERRVGAAVVCGRAAGSARARVELCQGWGGAAGRRGRGLWAAHHRLGQGGDHREGRVQVERADTAAREGGRAGRPLLA